MGEGELFWLIYEIIIIIICGILIILMQTDSRKRGYKSFIHFIFGSHIHKWVYMRGANHAWFYCRYCMAHSRVTINVSGHVEIKVFEKWQLPKR